MKLDIAFFCIIRCGTWAHPLRIRRSPKGDFYAELGDRGGARLPGSPILGGFDDFAWLLANAAAVHAQLVEKREALRTQPTFPSHD